jgi:hypothetical protein
LHKEDPDLALSAEMEEYLHVREAAGSQFAIKQQDDFQLD